MFILKFKDKNHLFLNDKKDEFIKPVCDHLILEQSELEVFVVKDEKPVKKILSNQNNVIVSGNNPGEIVIMGPEKDQDDMMVMKEIMKVQGEKIKFPYDKDWNFLGYGL